MPLCILLLLLPQLVFSQQASIPSSAYPTSPLSSIPGITYPDSPLYKPQTKDNSFSPTTNVGGYQSSSSSLSTQPSQSDSFPTASLVGSLMGNGYTGYPTSPSINTQSFNQFVNHAYSQPNELSQKSSFLGQSHIPTLLATTGTNTGIDTSVGGLVDSSSLPNLGDLTRSAPFSPSLTGYATSVLPYNHPQLSQIPLNPHISPITTNMNNIPKPKNEQVASDLESRFGIPSISSSQFVQSALPGNSMFPQIPASDSNLSVSDGRSNSGTATALELLLSQLQKPSITETSASSQSSPLFTSLSSPQNPTLSSLLTSSLLSSTLNSNSQTARTFPDPSVSSFPSSLNTPLESVSLPPSTTLLGNTGINPYAFTGYQMETTNKLLVQSSLEHSKNYIQKVEKELDRKIEKFINKLDDCYQEAQYTIKEKEMDKLSQRRMIHFERLVEDSLAAIDLARNWAASRIEDSRYEVRQQLKSARKYVKSKNEFSGLHSQLQEFLRDRMDSLKTCLDKEVERINETIREFKKVRDNAVSNVTRA